MQRTQAILYILGLVVCMSALAISSVPDDSEKNRFHNNPFLDKFTADFFSRFDRQFQDQELRRLIGIDTELSGNTNAQYSGGDAKITHVITLDLHKGQVWFLLYRTGPDLRSAERVAISTSRDMKFQSWIHLETVSELSGLAITLDESIDFETINLAEGIGLRVYRDGQLKLTEFIQEEEKTIQQKIELLLNSQDKE